MKITDVTLTLFAWDDIPATQYGQHTGKFGGASKMGLLTIETDEGVSGHAFLGSSSRGANMDGESLIAYLKRATATDAETPPPSGRSAPEPGETTPQ